MCELAAWEVAACMENGGIDEFIVYEIADRATLTVVSGAVTALTMAVGTKAYRWTPDMESANATETTTGNRVNNSVMNAQTAMIVFNNDLDATVNTIENLSRAKLGIIIKKSDPENAVYRHYGLKNGLTLETGEGVIGQLYEDLRGHTLNFVGKELAKAPSIDETIVDAMLIVAS